ncbi:MAG: dihydrodipicolinate synthase family protein [Humidesulfovibrio sp.]|uniref:dihydrodipicolinate synthase family protein n=1 Tax=Humidesulfovibrio sp. TaxID=2910988 RepID=UPI0027FE2201|nr:dihydrodipicolinate synthase family protein [Humidesulfovibrio sp.]MDQ7834265.1 dihydrodipicolinate synthase family protein [Humidesulfovibrio sp.]
MIFPRIVVPVITPFAPDGRVYETGVENLLQFLRRHGITGLWVLGSYGAFPLLDQDQRKHAATVFLSTAKKLGMTTVIQVGAPSVEHATDLARHAENSGADAVASVVPFYYSSSHYNEENFLDYFGQLSKATKLPLFYYNNPKTTGYTPSIAFLQKLVDVGVRGIKDTTSDFISITDKLRVFDESTAPGTYLGGSSSVYLPCRLMGAPGVVCGTAVALPEFILAMDQAIQDGDMVQAQKLQRTVHRVREIQGRYVGRSAACYDILHARGVDVGTVKPPWRRMTREQAREIMADLAALPGVLPLGPEA